MDWRMIFISIVRVLVLFYRRSHITFSSARILGSCSWTWPLWILGSWMREDEVDGVYALFFSLVPFVFRHR